MAIKVQPNKVYHCVNPTITTASIHVVSGSYTIKGSNVTELDPVTRKIIVPKKAELVATDDDAINAGKIYLLSNVPEWIMFEGTDGGEIWVKCGVDARFEPSEE